MIQRYFSSFLLGFYSLLCLACLIWSADSVLRPLKYSFQYLVSPVDRSILSEMERWGSFGRNLSRLVSLDMQYHELNQELQRRILDGEKLRALESENERLVNLLSLSPHPEWRPLGARLLARDANDWFHSIWIDRGELEGVPPEAPVLAFQKGEAVAVGQIIEIMPHTSRVLLITDPFSAVSVRVPARSEDGVVEGLGLGRMTLNYLFQDSAIQIGDSVMTAGLGRIFPEGILVGRVRALEDVSRETFFKRAIIEPALRLDNLHEVVVMVRIGGGPSAPAALPAPAPGRRRL